MNIEVFLETCTAGFALIVLSMAGIMWWSKRRLSK